MTEIETPDDEPRTIYDIPAANLSSFEAACAKLSRKSVKLGCGEIKPFVFGFNIKMGKDGFEYKVYEVLLTCDPVIIEGWKFIATIDHSQETGNLVRTVPNTGVTLPEVYRTAPPSCSHCGVNRYRRDTYVVHCEATDEYQQVGKSCLHSFLGIDPYKIARMAELQGFAAECARGFGFDSFVGGDQRYIPLEPYLRHCAAMVRLYGWLSRGNAKLIPNMEATADRAIGNMFPLQGYEIYAEKITDEDTQMATAALTWAETLREKENKTDYEHNVCIIADAEMIEFRSAGLAASIVGVYALTTEREIARRAQREAMKGSQHIGTIGERLRNLKATVLTHRTRESELYGTTHIYRFATVEGDVLVWFSSRNVGVHAGESVTLTGTVKEHSSFEGVANSILSRCKVVKDA